MREKAVSRSREHSKDVALCGLFAALVAVGAFIKVVIPTGADTMNFTLQWFFLCCIRNNDTTDCFFFRRSWKNQYSVC